MKTFVNRKAQRATKVRNTVDAAVQLLEKRLLLTASPFQSGDVAIYQVGSGSGTLSTAATPVYLDEYSPGGTLEQSFLVGSGSGLDTNPLTASGTVSSTFEEGLLTLSSNGQYLLLPGYDNAPGTANIASSTSADAVGEIARIDSQGNIDTSTTIGNLLSLTSGIGTDNVRGAASADGTNLYVDGTKGAVYTTIDTTSGAVELMSSATNLRAIEVNGGQLYADSATGDNGNLGDLGSGLPNSSNANSLTFNSSNDLPGITGGNPAGAGLGEPYAFAFATLGGGSSPDTLYVADNYNGCVDKYSLVSGSWSLTGEIGNYNSGSELLRGIEGIAAEPVSGGEQLFMTNGSTLYTVTDPYGYNSVGATASPSGTAAGGVFSSTPPLTLLATAAANTQFRGVALVPQPADVAIDTSPVATSVPAGTNATFTATAYGVNQSVQWQVNVYNPMTSSYAGFANILTSNSAYTGATTDTLTVVNTTLAENMYEYRAVFSNSAPSSAMSSAATLTVTQVPSISMVSPIYGPPAGGTTVTISGENLLGATVYFGTPGPSTSASIVSDSAGSIVVTSPAESGGAVNVTVITAGGTSATSSADVFTYASTPTVAGVGSTPAASPDSGEDRGGTTVTITGSGFISGSTVTFGGIAATGVVVNSYTSITAVDPAAATSGPLNYPVDGGVDVQVTTPLGTSAVNPTTPSNLNGDTFTYTPFTNADAELLGPTSDVPGVTLDNGSIVTAILSEPGTTNGVSYTNWAFLINDGTGSIDVYGPLSGTNESYTPHVGDEITVQGAYDPYDDIPEIDPGTTGSITLISSGNAIPSSYYPTITLATASVVPQPPSLAAQLVTINSATLTNLGATQFGTGDLPPTGQATPANIADSSYPAGISYYYFPSSYSFANASFDHLPVPTTAVTLTGIVDVYEGVAEFVAISELGLPEEFTVTNTATPITVAHGPEAGDPEADGFDSMSRGSSITVTVTRTYPLGGSDNDIATVGYTITPDSAVEGIDYTVPGGTTTNGVTTGTLTFPAGTTTQTFTINSTANPGDFGDKIFTITLGSATTNNPAATLNPTGYLPFVITGPSPIVIIDPNSEATVSENSIDETANIGTSGVELTGAAQTTSGVTIENSTNGDDYYAVLTFDDENADQSDELNTGETFQTIDGIELETQAAPKSYDASGPLNVYLVEDTITGDPYPVTTEPTSAGLNFLTSSTPVAPSTLYGDPIQGLGNQLGTTYLLGTIQYNLNQVPGGYTPYNLTNLDPTGVAMLAADLTSGGAFTIAITPGVVGVAATWVGDASNDTESPILRVDYATTLPAWVNPSSSAVWITPTQNLSVTGAATIIANPASYSNVPIIFATDGSSSVTTVNVPSATGIVPISLGGISLTGGASMIVDSISGTQSANHYVLDIASGGTFNIDTSSYLNLMSNDAIFLGGSLSAVTASLATGYNSGGWNGDGIRSSTAAGTSGLTSLGVELNNNGSGGVLDSTFDGQTVTNTAVLVKYTYAGDANLDGVVNGSDYTLIDNGYNAGLTGWRNGDFNYSGSINGNDYLLIDNAYNMQGSPLAEPATSSEPVAPVPASPLSSVFSTGPSIAVSIPGSTGATATVDDGLFNNDKKSVADELFDDDSSAN
jgi:hypothetical protein